MEEKRRGRVRGGKFEAGVEEREREKGRIGEGGTREK